MRDEIEEGEGEGESVRLTVVVERRITMKVSEEWRERHEKRMKTVRVERGEGEDGGEIEKKGEGEKVSSTPMDRQVASQSTGQRKEQSQGLGDGWEW